MRDVDTDIEKETDRVDVSVGSSRLSDVVADNDIEWESDDVTFPELFEGDVLSVKIDIEVAWDIDWLR